ncbi:MAG: TolC family protein [Spirochaetaceae bacterium]|jgi:outer membrane protein TolC|nr:TolC family protein [Spirochaetaceae bacterium]
MKQAILFYMLMFGVAALASPQDSAEQVLSLDVDEAVRLALNNNLGLQRNALDLDEKQRAAGRSWNSLVPALGVSVAASRPAPVIGAIPAEQDVWTPGVQLSASLTLSAATFENIKKARADYEAGALAFGQARQELELQTRKLFYQLILLDANRALAAQSLESAHARYEQSAALARAGQVSRLDELSARVDWENQKPTLRNAETACENALDSFKALLGIPGSQPLTLNGTLDYAGAAGTDVTRGESFESAALLKSIETLEITRRAAQTGAYAPSLRLSWNAAPVYRNDAWTDNAGSFSVSFGLNIDNFLPWSAAKTQIDDLDSRIAAARIQLAESRQNRETRTAQYRRAIEKSAETIEALKLNVELAQTVCDLYEDAYRKGAADYQQLRDAGDSLLQAQNRVQQEQYNLIAAVLDMEKEQNTPFAPIK